MGVVCSRACHRSGWVLADGDELPGRTRARGADTEGEASTYPRGARASSGGRKEIERAKESLRERRSKRGGRREREKMPPQQQQHDPSKSKYEPQLVYRLGAGGEGAGKQQLQSQQQPQQPRQQRQQSDNFCTIAQLPPQPSPPPP